jgi:curved DNA-binding protein
MQYQDYYKTLGVDKTASDQEIKRAYRKLAREYHPDVNPDDKKAEERFKQINEAYQVLSDSDKRQKYDRLGADWMRYQQQGGQAGAYDWSRWSGGRGPGGAHVRYGTPEDLQDILGGMGGGGFSDFFRTIFGMGGGGSSRTSYDFSGAGGFGGGAGRRASQHRAQDLNIEHPVEISLYQAYHGTSVTLEKGGRQLNAKIPAGARTHTKVRLKGEGTPNPMGGADGDLLLVIKVREDPTFERRGDDLYVDVPVDLYTALLGGQVRVRTLSGPVMLTVKPETQNGQTLRLRGKGMPKLRKKDAYGDLYASIAVQLPTDLTERQRELLQEMRELGN